MRVSRAVLNRRRVLCTPLAAARAADPQDPFRDRPGEDPWQVIPACASRSSATPGSCVLPPTTVADDVRGGDAQPGYARTPFAKSAVGARRGSLPPAPRRALPGWAQPGCAARSARGALPGGARDLRAAASQPACSACRSRCRTSVGAVALAAAFCTPSVDASVAAGSPQPGGGRAGVSGKIVPPTPATELAPHTTCLAPELAARDARQGRPPRRWARWPRAAILELLGWRSATYSLRRTDRTEASPAGLFMSGDGVAQCASLYWRADRNPPVGDAA